MKAKYKKIACFILMIIMVLIASINSVQASDFSMKLIGDKNKIKAGEQLTVKVSLDNVGSITNGINVFLATIDYDKNVFEPLKEEDITTLNSWSGMMYNEDNGKIIVENHSFTEEEKDIIELKLTAKTEISEKEANISIKGAESSMGVTAMKADDASLTIKIQKDNIMIIVIVVVAVAIVAGIIIYFIKKKKGAK